MLTQRQEEMLLDVNPQEALPRGVQKPQRPGVTGVALSDNPEVTAYMRDHELFRMRTQPELYEDWMRDLVEDHRARLAEETGQFDWDCHVCKTSVMTYDISDKCPRCGA